MNFETYFSYRFAISYSNYFCCCCKNWGGDKGTCTIFSLFFMRRSPFFLLQHNKLQISYILLANSAERTGCTSLGCIFFQGFLAFSILLQTISIWNFLRDSFPCETILLSFCIVHIQISSSFCCNLNLVAVNLWFYTFDFCFTAPKFSLYFVTIINFLPCQCTPTTFLKSQFHNYVPFSPSSSRDI